MAVPRETCGGSRKISDGNKPMGIGMRGGAPVAMPDTYGLPVYRVDKTIMQRVGDEIHILVGHVVFGQTQWTHIEVLKLGTAIVESTKCHDIASGIGCDDTELVGQSAH